MSANMKQADSANEHYVKLHNEQDLTTDRPKHLSVNIIEDYYTKYDRFAIIITFFSIISLISWIFYILYNFMECGVTTGYCKKPNYSCDATYWNKPYAQCCDADGIKTTCYNRSTLSCDGLSQTISTFCVQILLIFVILWYICLLFKSSKKGVEIHRQSQTITKTKNKVKSTFQTIVDFKKRLESKRIDCRKCAYSNRETPQKTAVQFLWNSLTILSVLRLLKSSPTILLNIFTGNDTLKAVGIAMLFIDIGNILQMLWANYCCCCNPCRGKCCGDNCCCDCCCECLACKCCCSHFPEHHKPYVESVAAVINYSNYLKMASGVAQITAVGFIDSASEYHLWLICLNFVSGVMKIFGTLQIYWRYYYLLCFYWSRMAVNKMESYKIHELLNKLLVGAYIFRIKVENEDEFIRVGADEEIANRVTVKCNCFTCGWVLNMLMLCAGIVFLFYNWTKKLNQNFNIDDNLFNFDIGI